VSCLFGFFYKEKHVMSRKKSCVGLVLLLFCATFLQAETLSISGASKVFDCSVDVTNGYANTGSTLWMREYWNNDYAGFGAYDCRPLVRVDLSDVPVGATIDSVSVNFKVVYASNPNAAYVDLYKVHPFTNDVTAWTYDGVNDWPTVDPNYGVSYFDGIDGYYQTPADKHLAESDIAIGSGTGASDQWMAFASDTLDEYIQTQSDMAAGSRYAYLELVFQDSDSEWAEFYSSESDASIMPYMEVTYTIPEPATLGLLGMGVLTLLRRKK
jgi:hypothetical protein